MSKLSGIPSSSENGAHDLERAALALQLGAAQRIDSQSRRKLTRAVHRVEDAERRYRIANARVDRFKSGSMVRSLLANEQAEISRAQRRAEDEIDRSTPKVRPITVIFGELVLLVAEFAFYFDIFGRSLQDDSPFIVQAFTAILALLVPVVGIMSARFFAGAVHYLRAGESRRSAMVFVTSSTLLLAAACFTTIRLVEWRYQAEEEANFGAVEHPPGTIMAIVFAVFILVDALTRAFMFDPAESTSIGRRWKARYTRAVDWLLLLRESAALTRWQKKWFTAKALVEKLKNDADQELLSATVGILLNRGASGRPASKLRSADYAFELDGEVVSGDGQRLIKVARNSGAPDEQLDESNSHVFLPHRLIRLAIARLEAVRPPDDPEQERRDARKDLAQDIKAPHDMSRVENSVPPAGSSQRVQPPHGFVSAIDSAVSASAPNG
ncbi:hypothetical protein C6A86_023680 [Mycobacterium sp. ITM-2016-00316]|uniref:hypothetical protein n=1 Tax=Mycobacterium sp. ITM-2016-00316 TaxID=2099695 RepID=UPI00287FE19F|nr:hypothetical protein [Mycobacterium sp. ITM-2016-00316]WNG81161.1 hypothetical protein C6A86_023680 [Mycobacterium sp. ITM-2016-00316]